MTKNEDQDLWTLWKTTLEQKTATLGQLDAWADSVVQEFWRPITGGLLVLMPALYLFSRFVVGKRFRTAAHIPQEVLEKGLKIRGKVVAVGDSDNFRLYHTPGFGWGWIRKVPQTKRELANQTIAIRIAGVDAPESAHFGMPAQPFSAEAKEFLTNMVLNKNVQVQLLSRDQYSRVVAMAYVRSSPFFLKKNVSLEMVKAGLASIYVAKGAQYAGILDQLKKHEDKAK
ncbi:hypothetical protein RO3G_09837 [Rhizopus delemar RA 99-880]|uniref:TNase-like domain-containing protein n=3 Tax=Rhizopus TaxID=4842 RepID=I1C9J7_RHIO9|nr:hypothetical protein RO3G_09837 [Rhizopus delemar RA 99-880]|eukprot:EIE85127.1 hypothetical protein RO3G_09837 [Rhizopus delemar RA 99-880]